ncbi:oxygenase MpaB family protein [Umezawaea sp. Da 62-37]|uniref:oxygenase MpaB family protein n=1 Tax=Umezawaea sp. Da 62-37 TaxID=3075927 RepID=UPI0028F71506|nr:oxygenase MpaB family protein [Umezawaea sp. Da 62-37]WNV91119.1 oxygenase MpaB family protein [Umezawaea sp. Da 62-37]
MATPNSVTWQLHADPAMWVAGIASLYLQALHPRAAAGVVQNSNFQRDPLGRLSRTATFVGVSTYGTAEEVEAAASKVRAVHRSLRGTDPESGASFRIDDPELLRWVHCAEVHSFLTVVRRAGYRLTDAQADRYLDEQRQPATLVGLHADEVPGSVAEMAAYLREARPGLRGSADADVVYRFLHRPPVRGALRWGLGVYERVLGHLAYSVLPDWAIGVYGHRPYPPAVATAMLRTLRGAALLVPGLVRWRVPTGHVNRAVRRIGWSAYPRRALLP